MNVCSSPKKSQKHDRCLQSTSIGLLPKYHSFSTNQVKQRCGHPHAKRLGLCPNGDKMGVFYMQTLKFKGTKPKFTGFLLLPIPTLGTWPSCTSINIYTSKTWKSLCSLTKSKSSDAAAFLTTDQKQFHLSSASLSSPIVVLHKRPNGQSSSFSIVSLVKG